MIVLRAEMVVGLLLATTCSTAYPHESRGRDMCAELLKLKIENAQTDGEWLKNIDLVKFDTNRSLVLITTPYPRGTEGLRLLERTAANYGVQVPEAIRFESGPGNEHSELSLLATGLPENLVHFLRSVYAQKLIFPERTSILTLVGTETLPLISYGQKFLSLDERSFKEGMDRIISPGHFGSTFGLNIQDSGYFLVRMPFEDAEIYMNYLEQNSAVAPKYLDSRGTNSMTFQDFKVALLGVLNGETRLILSERNTAHAVLIGLKEWDDWWQLSKKKKKTSLAFPYRTLTTRLVRALTKTQSKTKSFDEEALGVQPQTAEGDRHAETEYVPPKGPEIAPSVVVDKQTRKPHQRPKFVPLKSLSGAEGSSQLKTQIAGRPRTMSIGAFSLRNGAFDLAKGKPKVRLSEVSPITWLAPNPLDAKTRNDYAFLAAFVQASAIKKLPPENILASLEKQMPSAPPLYWEAELESFREGRGQYSSIRLKDLKGKKAVNILSRKTLVVVTDDATDNDLYVILPL